MCVREDGGCGERQEGEYEKNMLLLNLEKGLLNVVLPRVRTHFARPCTLPPPASFLPAHSARDPRLRLPPKLQDASLNLASYASRYFHALWGQVGGVRASDVGEPDAVAGGLSLYGRAAGDGRMHGAGVPLPARCEQSAEAQPLKMRRTTKDETPVKRLVRDPSLDGLATDEGVLGLHGAGVPLSARCAPIAEAQPLTANGEAVR